MKTLALSALLFLTGSAVFGQNPPDVSEKVPAGVDEALRARVDKYYGAFVAGKFKEAYLMVADDSQDKFFELDKTQYKSCEITKTNYSDNFTKATVVTSCKSEWRWRGTVFPATLPLTSNWELIDGQWFWHYQKPTMVPSPFSPTGFVPVPKETSRQDLSGLIPKDIPGAAKAILAQVGIDRPFVRLHSYETSQDVVHVHNDMPGGVSLTLEKPNMAGLKVTVEKTVLKAHDETTISFEWRLDDPAIQCLDCAKKMVGHVAVKLHIAPTGQVFPIDVGFENVPSQK